MDSSVAVDTGTGTLCGVELMVDRELLSLICKIFPFADALILDYKTVLAALVICAFSSNQIIDT